MNRFIILILSLFCVSLWAIDPARVFENQKKSAFPDTVEIQMRTTVTLPGNAAQKIEMTILNSGKDKSITKIYSPFINMKMVKNGSLISVTDLTTGAVLPAQNVPGESNVLDIEEQMGAPEDYEAPVKENGLWKLVPKKNGKPTLYYSEKEKRIVKMKALIEGVFAETNFSYCKNTCDLPGTLSKVEIVTIPQGGPPSTVIVEVISAKKRSNIPNALFNIK